MRFFSDGGQDPARETNQRKDWRILVTNGEGQPLALAGSAKSMDCGGLWIRFPAFERRYQLSRGLRHKSGFPNIEAVVLAAVLYQLITLKPHASLSRKPELVDLVRLTTRPDQTNHLDH